MAAAAGDDDSRVDWTGAGMGGSGAAGRGGSGATEEAGSIGGARDVSKTWRASGASKTAMAGGAVKGIVGGSNSGEGSKAVDTGEEGSRAEGTGISGNEAGRGAGAWTTLYLGYRPCIAFLKSSQLAGSARTSLTESQVFQDFSLV
jgi:hypothetical protein